MIRVTNETKAAYKNDSAVKHVEIRIPDANITLLDSDVVEESLNLQEAIETESNLTFTGCIASCFSFECFNLVDETLEGKWIEADIYTTEGEGDDEVIGETIPLFRGYIDEVTNLTHEEFTTKIRAYDALYQINSLDVTAWRNSIVFPISIQNLRNSFFNYIGIPQRQDFLPNDGILITSPQIEDAVVTGGKIIKAICSINGRFGRIGRDGYFEYVHLVEGTEALYPAETLFPDDDLYPHAENAVDNVAKGYYMRLEFENYKTVAIGKVQLVNKSGAISASYGTGENVYTLKDNPLVWGLNQSSLNQVVINLFNTIQGIWYVPAHVDCVGLPYLECGDFVVLVAQRSIVRAYVLQRTLKGIQDIRDSYTANGDKLQPRYVPSIQAQINANTEAIENESSRASSAESGLQNGVNANTTKISNLQADTANIKNVVATKASIEQLNAVNVNVSGRIDAANGNINNLYSRVANLDTVVAGKASISQLNATNATVNNMRASMITSSNLASNIANISLLRCGGIQTGAITTNGVSVGGTLSNHGGRLATIEGILRRHGWM
jgi:hypothetical protein